MLIPSVFLLLGGVKEILFKWATICLEIQN